MVLICTMIRDREKEWEILRKSMELWHPGVEWLIHDPGIGPDFTGIMMQKTDAAAESIRRVGYAIWMDCDMVVLRAGIPDFVGLLESGIEVVVSPHYTSTWRENMYGRYNAGMWATKDLRFLAQWRELTGRRILFTDQKPFELCVKGMRVYELGHEHNCGHWRYPICKVRDERMSINGVETVTYHGHLVNGNDP